MKIDIAGLVSEGTTPDERALIASEQWNRAKRALHFANSEAARRRADAQRAAALRLYVQARRQGRPAGKA